MAIIFKNPFNYIVRSNEAAIIGLLIGAILGVILMMSIPITIKEEMYEVPTNMCGVDGMISADYNYVGFVIQVKCKDGKIHKISSF
jgi:hypothetical protein